MDYLELNVFPVEGSHIADLLVNKLAEIGFESFVDNENGSISAYVPSSEFSQESQAALNSEEYKSYIKSFTINTIPDQNWNAVWESSYDKVTIDNRCVVRAPFHEKIDTVLYDIVIMPKMSFGTAHHETTHLMLEYMLDADVKGKSLLDMGSGTAVLAILARMKGADPIVAIDNDEWAFNNALENVKSNNFPEIKVMLGDSAMLTGMQFEVIFANINRNILLNDMHMYRNSMLPGAKLFISGFYSEDLPILVAKASSLGLSLLSSRVRNNWTAACFTI